MKKKIEEKWIILGLCCLVLCGGVGLGNGRSVLLDSICNDLNMSRSEYGLSGTISTFVSMIMSMFSTEIFRRLGVKRTVGMGLSFYIIGYIIAGLATGKIMLYISYCLLGVGGSLMGSSILMIVVNQWFVINSGLASGILMSFTGVAGAIFSPIFSAINDATNWRTVMFICAGLGVLFTSPTILHKRSFIPVITETEVDKNRNILNKDVQVPALDVILLCTQHALTSYGVAIVSYLSSIALSKGLDTNTAALTVSMFMIGNLSFKLLFGPLADKFGASHTTLLLLLVNLSSCILLVTAHSTFWMLFTSLVYGSLYGIIALGTSLTSKQMYGNEGYIKCLPKISVSYSLTYALLSPVVGSIYDKTGSYDIILYVNIVMIVLAFVVSLIIDKRLNKIQAVSAK